MNCGILYNQHDLVTMIANDNTQFKNHWQYQSYLQFSKTLEQTGFPCLFGRKAYLSMQCKILFVAAKNNDIVIDDLVNGFLSYVHFVQNTDIGDRLFSPMIVFLHHQQSSLKKQHTFAWQVVQQLHDHDPVGWPDNVQHDPENHEWSFCFGGVQLFINISAPAHTLMKSRNLGDCVVLVVNPRENFDKVANLQETSGVKIRQKIRDRVCQYNNGFVPETLGFFGDLNNLEWKQYQLHEPGALNAAKCPITINVKKK